MFSIVLLGSCSKDIEGCTDIYSTNYNSEATIDDGSCSDQRIVKFSIERTSSEPTYVWNADSGGDTCGYFGVSVSFDYSGGGGISQVSGGAMSRHIHPLWQQLSGFENYENIIYDESDPVTMIKNDNVTLQIGYQGAYCDYTGSYIIKAYVGNNELIIEENYSPPPSVNPNGFNGGESKNWIVP